MKVFARIALITLLVLSLVGAGLVIGGGSMAMGHSTVCSTHCVGLGGSTVESQAPLPVRQLWPLFLAIVALGLAFITLGLGTFPDHRKRLYAYLSPPLYRLNMTYTGYLM